MNKHGKKFSNASWETVKDVKADDVIFCNKDREIVYVATATADADDAPRPPNRSFDQWEREGTRVDVYLTVLEHPIDELTLTTDSPSFLTWTDCSIGA